MKRFVFILLSLCFLCGGALAECGTREEALAILECNVPYRHTVSPKAMEAWERGNADAVIHMDVTAEERKTGIHKWAAAVQMFQKLYCPENPVFMDSVDGRYLLDAFMVDGGLMPHVYHVLPEEDEISRDAAWEKAEDALREQFGLSFAGTFRNIWVDTHYFTPTGAKADAFWLFHVELENRAKYSIRVQGGEVTLCRRLEQEEALFESYTKLCDEKGAFFTWTPDEKWEYASQLPEAILSAYMEGQDLDRCGDLLAIAGQGFSLPANGVMARAEALEKANQAVKEKFGLNGGWADQAEIGYSLFRQGDVFIWRVIFWKTGRNEMPGAVVDMNAITGEAFRVERYDGTPESIPYRERL